MFDYNIINECKLTTYPNPSTTDGKNTINVYESKTTHVYFAFFTSQDDREWFYISRYNRIRLIFSPSFRYFTLKKKKCI